MKESYRKLVEDVPDYDAFLTVDELDAGSFALAKRYPKTVRVFPIGKTKEGRTLFCLKIGSGSKNALMFGCPHPNEPIGAMMLEYFSEQLAGNESLRRELDYTWYIVKAWDADGLKLNEGWLKGPFTIRNYARHFFRPAGYRQVDWTFPVDYKELHFHAPVPETEAMMRLIDDIKPHFIYSLHNAGFGGVYWYVSSPIDPVYDAMRAAAEKEGVPLNLGEPETPYCEMLSPAVYKLFGIEKEYDYLEQYGAERINEIINAGNCSASYAKKRYGSFTLLTELPYFYDARIMNLRNGSMTRKEAVSRSLDENAEANRYLKAMLERAKGLVDDENPFKLALEAFSAGREEESTRRMIEQNPEYARTATVAEEFDNLLMSRFYKCLSYGMAIRMNEYELERMAKRRETDPEKEKKLRDNAADAEKAFTALVTQVEGALDYEAVPIRKLVRIQLACGLLVSEYLHDKNLKEGI